jgi:hypothetical protein
MRTTIITITLKSDIEPDDLLTESNHDSLVEGLRRYGELDCRTTSGGGPVKFHVSVKDYPKS